MLCHSGQLAKVFVFVFVFVFPHSPLLKPQLALPAEENDKVDHDCKYFCSHQIQGGIRTSASGKSFYTIDHKCWFPCKQSGQFPENRVFLLLTKKNISTCASSFTPSPIRTTSLHVEPVDAGGRLLRQYCAS